MRKLTTTICLMIAVLLGSVGMSESESADYQKGLAAYKSGDYTTALRELKSLGDNRRKRNLYRLDKLQWMQNGLNKTPEILINQWMHIMIDT